jgi:flagellar hook-associated protein 1
MSSIMSSMHIGVSALSSHQGRMSVISNNVANASTPGYRRQRVNMVTLGGQLALQSQHGVGTSGRQSIEAPFIQRQLAAQLGDLGYHASKYEVSSILESRLSPLNGNSLSNNLDNFFNGAQLVSADPSSSVHRTQLLQEAENVVRSFSNTADHFRQTQDGIQTETGDLIDSINSNLLQIEKLDKAIVDGDARGEDPGDLVDERNRMASEISELTGARVVQEKNQRLSLVLPNGRSLMEGGRARQLQLNTAALPGLEIEISTGSGFFQALGRPGGRLGGLLETHNFIDTEMTALDQLAFDFAGTINGIQTAGDDVTGTPGGAFFTPLGVPAGAASGLVVALTSGDEIAAAATGGGPGDNTNALALSDARNTGLSNGRTTTENSDDMLLRVGTIVRESSTSVETTSLNITQLENLRESISGVSLEEEMVAMTEAQRAFEAAMKVIKTSDEMIETILSIKR